MRLTFKVLLIASAFLLIPALAWCSPTPACSATTCLNDCNTYCTSKHQVCETSTVHITCGDCGPGTCSFLCDQGSGQTYNCSCGNCPGGSPIFKKQPTGPAPTVSNASPAPTPAAAAAPAASTESVDAATCGDTKPAAPNTEKAPKPADGAGKETKPPAAPQPRS